MKTAIRHTLVFLTLVTLLPVSAIDGRAAGLRNQLAGNPSPYLAMHAGDPTAWQSWSQATVNKARKQNKLLFVSVGYFSCHWCHVMQRESYQNKDIAALINRHFIPVKIDRETEPALDAHLIAFAERSQGFSGWPLNVFLTPDGYPLYATVYLPPKDFRQLLEKLNGLWAENPVELARLAAEEQPGGKGPGQPVRQTQLAAQLSEAAATQALQIGSPMTGGFGDANKFPLAPQIEFLLERAAQNPDKSLREFLMLTLDNMARYGLRDHLQGGFFRYTVDPGWKTPHFEKMLYDNAQMATVYMKAASIFENGLYDDVAKSTLDFMQAHMMDPRGAMIASFSAIDDKNVEGGYYLWGKNELAGLLSSQEWQAYEMYAGMNDPSPLAEGYLPMQVVEVAQVARQLGMPAPRVQFLIDTAQKKMLRARSKRNLPADNKLLAGWNGLALSAFSSGARKYDSDQYRQTARSLRDYLVNVLWDGSRLVRATDQGKPLGRASLQDYASVARGLLDWAQLTNRKQDFQVAKRVVDQAWRRFYSSRGWRLSEPSYIPMEAPADVLVDNHMPSASASLIGVSLRLADVLGSGELRQQALSALNSGQDQVKADPFWYVTQIRVMASG